MAWWDSQHQQRSPGASSPSRPRLVMGDAFPRLESKYVEMERERALLSPVFEDHLGPSTTPALAVHVEIRFTDPVIRSRYCRNYGSSPSFEATDRICRGLVRRIERCSEEFLTRKDSGALEVFKDGSYERKPQRFEMTFRVLRKGKGEWAERTYRSYQKQPLTVAATKEIILASHRMVGLFLRRHDEHFRWLDTTVSDTDFESETMASSRNGHPSLLSVPRSRFVEATQAFEFVPGYGIELRFRSRSPQRRTPTFERRLKISSTQTTPLTLFMGEDLLGKALQVLNQELDSKKGELENHVRGHSDGSHSDDNALEIDLRISNNLGPAYSHLHRNVRSKLALFRDFQGGDSNDFLNGIENYLIRLRNEADAKINAANDLEFRILELKGVAWTLREPAMFTLGPSASYGRRTIQAALDRIQTGIGDVIRGHNIAIHINAHKRGHLVLDKAIVAHEKRGKPRETFASHEDAEAAFISRLKARIQKDLDKVFEDTCSIDDILEDEDEFERPSTPAHPEQALSEAGFSPMYSPMSTKSSPGKRPGTAVSRMQELPRPRAQRVFSLSRRSTESMRSIDYLKAGEDPFANDSSRPSTAATDVSSKSRLGDLSPLLTAAEIKPARRSFSLVSRRPSSVTRVSNASTLVEEQAVRAEDRNISGQNSKETGVVEEKPEESGRESMTSEQVVSPAGAPSGALPAEASPTLTSNPAGQSPGIPSQDDDNKPVLPIVREAKQRKMDSPETFVDAREFATSPAPVESELSAALAGERSPRADDEFSTAPSTPELITGGASPKHSALTTPVFLRTRSRTMDPVVLAPSCFPDSKPDEPETRLQAEITGTPASKGDHEDPIGQPSLDLPPQAISAAGATEESDNAPVETDGQGVAENSDLDAGVVVPQVASNVELNSAQDPPIQSAPSSASEADEISTPENQVLSEQLGAEAKAESDVRSPSPDFPTPDIRGSEPNKSPDHGPGFQGPSSGNVLGNKLEIPPESQVSESPGNELGTVAGAETEPVEDNASSDLPRDVQELPVSGDSDQGSGAEPEEVLSNSNVERETIAETEGSFGDDRHEETETKEAPTNDPAPGTTDATEDHPGNDGPGLVTDQPLAEEVTTPPVGPVKETEETGDLDTRTPETAVGDQLDATADGPGSSAETRRVEPEGHHILEQTAETVDEIRRSPIAESETDVPDSGDVPDGAVGDSEFKADEQSAALVDSGAEGGVDLPVEVEEGGVVAETETETELGVERAGDGDGVEAAGQDVAPELGEKEVIVPEVGEERVAVPELGDDKVSNTEAEPIADPTATDATDAGVPEPNVAEDAVGDVEDLADSLAETKLAAETGVDVRSDVLEEDLAKELEVRPDDDVRDVSGSESETVEPDAGAGSDVHLEVFDEGLAEELEVQPGDGVKGVSDSETEVVEPGSGAGSDARPEVLEEALADEQTQVDDGVRGVSGSEREILEPETDAEVNFRLEVLEKGPVDELELQAAENVKDVSHSARDVVDPDNGAELDVRSGVVDQGPADERIQVDDGIKDVFDSEKALEPGTGAEADVLPDIPEEVLADELEVRVDDDVKDVSDAEKDINPDASAVSDVLPAVREDLADELEVQAVDEVKEDSGVEREVSESDAAKTQCAEGHGPSPELTEVDAESEPKVPEPDVVDGLAPELEVQSDNVGGTESREFELESQPQVEAVAATEEPSDDKKLGSEVESEKTDNTSKDEGDKPEVVEKAGLSESLEPQSREEEYVVAPAISVEDLTVPFPDVSAPSAEAVKADIPASITIAPTELLPSEPQKPAPQPKKEEEKARFTPIPDVTNLLSPSPSREPLSTIDENASRTSVDTYRPSPDDEQQHPTVPAIPITPKPLRATTYRLQTAGYLGLRESRFPEIGLRGALGDIRSRRLSLPVQQHLLGPEAMSGERPSAPASEAGGSRKRLGGLKGGADTGDDGYGEGEGGGGGDAVLPKMVMLLAGAMALGRLMRGTPE